ncbi:MAG: hypothetical protein P0Y64_10365 [Candidatus Sphingomonas colombiensis]|nr:hypothetical protein [Sphingomonas sp.]WEK41812.1 MAG: hypothetical protein P0Y64_10365 [Sphingomonas sp.]
MAGFRFSRFGASVALAALALAGCKPAASDNQALLNNQSAAAALPDLPATLPMTDAPAAPITAAPRVAALPEAPPIRTVRVRDPGSGAGYAYADAAYRFSDALGEAPPDYGFDYEGVQPWAWQGYDDSVVFAEPVSGGYRTYYYRPGADQPYFVRDPYYSYGYDDGQLAVVYAADGAIVPWADYGPQVIYASRYLVRGRDLWRASREQRIPISAGSWNNQRGGWFGAQQQWGAVRARQPIWASYAQTDAPAQSHWQAEQVRRAADTNRFAEWQAQGFRSAPPPRAIPTQWQQASWAQNRNHFAPAAAAVVAGGAVAAEAVLAHDAAVAAQRRNAATMRQQQERQAQIADSARVQQEQARMVAQRQQQQQAMQAQAGRTQQAHAADMARRDQQAGQMQRQQAVRAEQQQARAADTARREQAQAARVQQAHATDMARREQQAGQTQRQQALRAEQQQARAAGVAQHREQQLEQTQRQQAARIEQQQSRAAAMAQRREQQANEIQHQQAARMEQQQARAADNARREQASAARAEEAQAHAQQQQARAAESAQRAQAQVARAAEQHAPRPAAPPREHPERPHDHR